MLTAVLREEGPKATPCCHVRGVRLSETTRPQGYMTQIGVNAKEVRMWMYDVLAVIRHKFTRGLEPETLTGHRLAWEPCTLCPSHGLKTPDRSQKCGIEGDHAS